MWLHVSTFVRADTQKKVVSFVGDVQNIGASPGFGLSGEELSADVTVSCWKNNVTCQSGKQRCEDSSREVTSNSHGVKNVCGPSHNKRQLLPRELA